MHTLLALLKINLVLSTSYLLYRLFLYRLTFFNLNRIFLAGSIMVSALAPFLSFTVNTPPPVYVATTPQLFIIPAKATNIPQVQATSVDWVYLLQLMYWAGTLLMGGLLLFRLVSLLLLYYKSGDLDYKGCRIRTMKGKNSPFSFFRSIFLNPQHYSEAELAVIVAHEKVHIRQWHSVDILLGALSRVFCWFNPLVWLLDKELHRNLEFIADDQVLQKGAERRHYQLSLLSVVTGKTSIYPTTYFNFSHLKIRIHMMNKQRSARFQLTKYAVSLILISGLLLSVGLSFGQQKTIKATTKKTTNTTPPAVKKAPMIVVDKKPVANLKAAVIDPAKVKNIKVVKDKTEAVSEYGEGAANGVIVETTANGAIDPQAAAPSVSSPRLPGPSNAPLIIVDGKVWEKSLVDINPKEVTSMKFLKDAPGIAQYVDAAKNGVVLVTTKK